MGTNLFQSNKLANIDYCAKRLTLLAAIESHQRMVSTPIIGLYLNRNLFILMNWITEWCERKGHRYQTHSNIHGLPGW